MFAHQGILPNFKKLSYIWKYLNTNNGKSFWSQSKEVYNAIAISSQKWAHLLLVTT